MPGLVKIGYTTKTIEDRLGQLNTTSTPSPFEIAAIFNVSEPKACEQKVHRKLERFRSNPKREFFCASVAELIGEVIDVIGEHISPSIVSSHKERSAEDQFVPDKDDIYFMFYLLHEAYENNQPWSTAALAEHHDGYAPLELEFKLMNLAQEGYVKRVNKEHEGLGKWQLLEKGLRFMFEGKHYAEDLVAEGRRNA